jgi:hypothetical protein
MSMIWLIVLGSASRLLSTFQGQLGVPDVYLVHELVHAPVAMLEPFSMHGIPFLDSALQVMPVS